MLCNVPGRIVKFKVFEPNIKTIQVSNVVNEGFADLSKTFQQLEKDYETNLTKDELDVLIQNGFNSLEAEIIYSKSLPGKLRKVINSV